MNTQLIHTIPGVNGVIDSVLRRILPILSTEPINTHTSRAVGIQLTLRDFKKDLSRLSAALRNHLFQSRHLLELKSENSTLFRYLSFVLAATIATLKKCEKALKRTAKEIPQADSKGSGGITHLPWAKKSHKSPEVVESSENKLKTLHLSIQHCNAATIVGTNIVSCLSITTDPKLHIHDVRLQIQSLINSVSSLQSINDSLNSVPSPAKTANFNGIMSNATELANVCVVETDLNLSKVHFGHIPMASLTEVLTRNSLIRSCTMESCLEVDGGESSLEDSRETSRNVSRDPSRNPSMNPSPVRGQQ